MKALRSMSASAWPVPPKLVASAQFARPRLPQPGIDTAPLSIAGQLTSCTLHAITDHVVLLRRADGVELMQCSVDSDGRFLLHGNCEYRGLAILCASGTSTPELRSVLLLDLRSDYHVNINPLTELLARKLGRLSRYDTNSRRWRSPGAARIRRIGQALAQTFGLHCLHSQAVILPIAADGSAQRERTNRYGQMLATIAALGWMQQESMAQIIDQLYKALDREMRLTADARVALLLAAAESGAADPCCVARALGITELAELIATENAPHPHPQSGPAPSLTQLHALGQRAPLASIHLYPGPARRS